jgi:hypothetical protein
MVKKSLFAIAAVALLAVAVQAGEIKIHDWPCAFIPQEVTTIPVTMDVGYWIKIKDQDKLKIKLSQKSIHEYSGCTDMVVETNVNITLSCSISATGAVPGKWSCTVSPADINMPGGTATVCAKVLEADLSKTAGGSKNVHVATVSIKVVPRV